MSRLNVFNNVSLDGYFTGANNDLSWAHAGADDEEFGAWIAGNASGGGALLMGRVTHDLMIQYWPTPMAIQNDPVVAKGMNDAKKYVFSRTLAQSSWKNTTILRGDVAEEVRKLEQVEEDITILGSGTIIAQLAETDLVDTWQFVIVPVFLGKGRTMFEGVTKPHALKLTASRSFRNGRVVNSYER